MLSDYIRKENILLELESTEKDVLFAEMTENLIRTNSGLNRKEIINCLEEREQKMNTCVMRCISVPHADCGCVKEPLVAIGLSRNGVDYEVCSYGSEKYNENLVHLVILILFQKGNVTQHLNLLADVARVLRIPGFYEALFNCKTCSELINTVFEYETEH